VWRERDWARPDFSRVQQMEAAGPESDLNPRSKLQRATKNISAETLKEDCCVRQESEEATSDRERAFPSQETNQEIGPLRNSCLKEPAIRFESSTTPTKICPCVHGLENGIREAQPVLFSPVKSEHEHKAKELNVDLEAKTSIVQEEVVPLTPISQPVNLAQAPREVAPTQVKLTQPTKLLPSSGSGGLRIDDVLRELVSTEESFYRNLCDVLDVYACQIRTIASGANGAVPAARLGIDLEMIDAVFGPGLEEVRATSLKMLCNLRTAQLQERNSVRRIVGVMHEMADDMHAYAPYNSSYAKTYAVLKNKIDNLPRHENTKLRRFISLGRRAPSHAAPNFMHLWEAFSAKHLKSETLSSLLIKPVQRIPRYSLLLREIRKSVAPDSPDIPLLEKTCSIYEQVASGINESVRAHERLARIFGNELETPLMGKTSSSPSSSAGLKIQNVYEVAMKVNSMSNSVTSRADLGGIINKQPANSRSKLEKML